MTAKTSPANKPQISESVPQSTPVFSSMADLMSKQSTKIITYKKGDMVPGIISRLTKHEILIDLTGKTEALVLEKDRNILKSLLTMLRVGDKVQVQILNPESDSGQPVVSLRRFIDQKVWLALEELKKQKETLEVIISESTKGGYVVKTAEGLTAFLPHSHTSFSSSGQLSIGQKIPVTVFDLVKQDNKIIVSQKSSMSTEEFEEIKNEFKKAQAVQVMITNITSFGLFVTVPLKKGKKHKTIDGLIHISEVAWEKTLELTGQFATGETIEASILGFDNDSKRLDLSIKRLSEDPFTVLAKRFPVETRTSGKVTKISGGNIHLDLGEGAEGIIRKEKVPPNVSYEVGQKVNVTVTDLDAKRHRILLSPVLLEKPIGYR